MMMTHDVQFGWKRGFVRSGALVLTLALVLACFAGRSDAQPPATVRVLGPAAPVAVGQTFTVTVAIENVQNLGAFEFEVNFNPAIASTSVDAIQLGTMLGSTGRTTGALRLASSPTLPGTPLFGAYSYGTPAGPNGSGVLATFSMNAVAPGASQLSLSGLKVTNTQGQELQATAIAGSVTVGNTTVRPIYLPLLRRNSSH